MNLQAIDSSRSLGSTHRWALWMGGRLTYGQSKPLHRVLRSHRAVGVRRLRGGQRSKPGKVKDGRRNSQTAMTFRIYARIQPYLCSLRRLLACFRRLKLAHAPIRGLLYVGLTEVLAKMEAFSLGSLPCLEATSAASHTRDQDSQVWSRGRSSRRQGRLVGHPETRSPSSQ